MFVLRMKLTFGVTIVTKNWHVCTLFATHPRFVQNQVRELSRRLGTALIQ